MPHEGYLRRSREHVGHLCEQNAGAGGTGLLRAEADHRHPRTPRTFGKTGALHELDPRQETTLSREWRCAKNTLSGFSLRQGGIPTPWGQRG